MTYSAEIKVTGKSQGPPGPPGTIGSYVISAAFQIPVDSSEVGIVPASTVVTLQDGQFLYGILPNNVLAKLRRSGSTYYLSALFNQAAVLTYPANTLLLISGATTLLAVVANTTLAISGPTVIQVEPNPLAVGASLLATAAGATGTLSRDANNTYFTPARPLSAAIPLVAHVDAVVISSDPKQVTELGDYANGLTLDNKSKLNLGNSAEIDFPVPIFRPGDYPLDPTSTGFFELILSTSKGILWGIATDGAVWIQGAATRLIGDNNLGAIEAWTDLAGRLALGIGLDGSVLMGWGKIKNLSRNNYGLIDAITDQDGKPLFGLKEDLSLYAPGVLSAPLEAYGSTYFLIADENGNRQIWRLSNGSLMQLTFRGDNSGIAIGDNNTLLFATNRNSAPEYYRMSQDGSKQFYFALDPVNLDTTLNHILVTGQSLSRGFTATQLLTLTQPYRNLKFNTGMMNADYFANNSAVNVSPTSFVPLVEDTAETGYATLANKVTEFANRFIKTNKYGVSDYRILISGHGYSAAAYSQIKKGTQCYTDGLDQITKGRSIATAQGLTNKVRVVFIVHGETDHLNLNAGYEANLVEWQNDYNNDINSIYGISGLVPMFQSQMSSWGYYNVGTTSLIPQAQLQAHRNNPGKIILVCPKYFLPYYNSGDNVHLTNVGYQVLFSYYAKAYRHVILQSKVWQPLMPTSITKSGLVITATFNVLCGPLALDTVNVSNPGNYGFEVVDSGGTVLTINSVALSGSQVIVTVASGTPARLRYAYRSNSGGGVAAGGGPTIGPRGNLRDSDTSTHNNGYTLYNWCVHFNDPIS